MLSIKKGEMLAAVWAMEKCRFFLLGMKTFILALDHKPLISMLGPQPIMNIPNPRLVSCKIKSLMYSFQPTHILPRQCHRPLTSTGDIWQSIEGSFVHHTLLPYYPPRVET